MLDNVLYETEREYYRNGQWIFFDSQPDGGDGIWGNNWDIFGVLQYGNSDDHAVVLVEFEYISNPEVWTIVEPIGVYYNMFYHRNAVYAVLRAWDDYENWGLDPYNFSSSTACQPGGDPPPQLPQNFAGTTYNNHPKLTWDNIEPDIEYVEIWWQIVADIKNPGAWNLLSTTTNTFFIDYGVSLGDGDYVKYKVRCKDYSGNYSYYTNIISYEFSGLQKQNIVNQSIEYQLFSNFPNPFNPSTEITYSIAQDADVTLRIYDILGTQVAELVNEAQTAGKHTINFSASILSSGVYIYRITASNNGRILFTDAKQMILLR